MDSVESQAGGGPRVKLRAEALTKTYGAVTALRAVSITVLEGEFVSLLGPSGSGKTTFLLMAAGLILPDSGSLWINGKLATYLPVQERDIGMVFQNYALFPHLTVFENIAFPLQHAQVARAGNPRRRSATRSRWSSLPHVERTLAARAVRRASSSASRWRAASSTSPRSS